MGYKYRVLWAKYHTWEMCWDGEEGFKTFNEAVRFVRKLQKQGYGIIDIICRDDLPNKGVKNARNII